MSCAVEMGIWGSHINTKEIVKNASLMISSSTVQHSNLYSEPVFSIVKPCLGCGGLTRLNLFPIDCDDCWGEGMIEDQYAYTGEMIICPYCHGAGENDHWLRYCCFECMECSNLY